MERERSSTHSKRPELEQLRQQLNEVDQQLLSQLKVRWALIDEVAQVKAEHRLPVYDQRREYEQIRKLSEQLDKEKETAIRTVWTALMRSSREQQYHHFYQAGLLSRLAKEWKQMGKGLSQFQRVGYVGNENAVSAQCLARWYPKVERSPFLSFVQAFKELREERVDALFVPLEDSQIGLFKEIYSLLQKEGGYIVEERWTQLPYALYAQGEAKLSSIQTVLMPTALLEECELFCRKMGWNVLDIGPGVEAFHLDILKQSPHHALLCTPFLAEAKGLTPLPTSLPTKKKQMLRYILVARQRVSLSSSPNRATFAFTVPQQSFALANSFCLLADMGIDILKVRTDTVNDAPWNLRVLFEVALPEQSENFLLALSMLQQESHDFFWMGAYEEIEMKSDFRPSFVLN